MTSQQQSPQRRSHALQIIPQALSFPSVSNKVETKTFILSNTSEYTVIYKIKTTAPKKYSVRPPAGLIYAGGKAEISVALSPSSEPGGGANNADKFQVHSVLMTVPMTPQDLWESTNTNPDLVTKQRLSVVIEPPIAGPSDNLEPIPVSISTPITNSSIIPPPSPFNQQTTQQQQQQQQNTNNPTTTTTNPIPPPSSNPTPPPIISQTQNTSENLTASNLTASDLSTSISKSEFFQSAMSIPILPLKQPQPDQQQKPIQQPTSTMEQQQPTTIQINSLTTLIANKDEELKKLQTRLRDTCGERDGLRAQVEVLNREIVALRTAEKSGSGISGGGGGHHGNLVADNGMLYLIAAFAILLAVILHAIFRN